MNYASAVCIDSSEVNGMDRRKYSVAVATSLGMLLLILDSRCALESSQQAMQLCIRSVIPSLFPFLFLAGLVTETLWGVQGKVTGAVARFFHIPSGGESLLLPAFLGGYPAGAIAIGDAFRNGQMKRKTADTLISYCSNVGPAFLFGMMSSQFPEKNMIWSLWGIHLLSAAMVGTIVSLPAEPLGTEKRKPRSISEVLMRSVMSMAMICGWILLFRILIGFLDRWFFFLLPDWFRIFLWGFLELSNGCWGLHQIENISFRFIAASAMLAFGGVCVMMQTASAAVGLSMKYYISGKLLHMAFSILLSAAVCCGLGFPAATCCVFFIFLERIYKKRSSNPTVSGV